MRRNRLRHTRYNTEVHTYNPRFSTDWPELAGFTSRQKCKWSWCRRPEECTQAKEWVWQSGNDLASPAWLRLHGWTLLRSLALPMRPRMTWKLKVEDFQLADRAMLFWCVYVACALASIPRYLLSIAETRPRHQTGVLIERSTRTPITTSSTHWPTESCIWRKKGAQRELNNNLKPLKNKPRCHDCKRKGPDMV
jgi:hypothetical protein